MEDLPRRRRWLVLVVCCMSLLIVGLDTTIVNVALPSINRELKASISGLQWTIDAYTLVLASLLMLAGSTADRIGRRRVFQLGLAVFSVGSLLCGLAPSLDTLIAARVVQAIGGSMLTPVAMSIVRNVFEDPRERAQAIGVWGATFGVSMALGPVLGGVLVDAVSWRAVFFVNVPIGLLAILLTALYVPESRAEHPRRLDPAGQLLVIALLASLTSGIIEAPRAGWTSAETLGLFGAAVACLGFLVPYELRREAPLLEMRFFRSIPFSGASAVAVLAFSAMGGFLLLSTLYLQTVRGLSPLHAGLYMLPAASMLLVCAPLSGWIVGRWGARVPMLLAACAIGVSALLLTGLAPGTPTPRLLIAYFLFGSGLGFVNPPITNTAVSGMPPAQAGVAAAIASTSRQVGVTLGVAVLGAISGGTLGAGIGKSFAHATHPGWWIIFGLAVAIGVLGSITTTRWAKGTARRIAARVGPSEERAYAGAYSGP